jgi:hypothetical protein
MSVWRRTHKEAAGAWRSLRYDMGRRPADPPAGGPDVTSTGMNTFGGTSWDFGPEPTELPVAGRMPPPRRQSQRRAVAVSSLGLLTVIGAAGAYLVVVNGLVPIRDEGPAAAGTLPPATAEAVLGRAEPAHRALRIPSSQDPVGQDPVGQDPASQDPAGQDPAPTPVSPRPAQRAHPKPVRKMSPLRTMKPTKTKCDCDHPPVPTPTAPASAPSPTPSAPTSPPTSASSSDESGNPSESPEPRMRPHHRRHH